MTYELEEFTQRRLLLVNLLYQQGIQHAVKDDIVNSILAIISFDLAIETILGITVETLAPSTTPAKSFEGLIDQISKHLDVLKLTSLPQVASIRRIHSFRNDAQHKGKYPHKEDIERSKNHTFIFLNELSIFSINRGTGVNRTPLLVKDEKLEQVVG